MSQSTRSVLAMQSDILAIFTKEFRSMLRERRGWMIPVIYVLVLGSVAGLFLITVGENGSDSQLGQVLAGVVAVVQTLALVTFAPLVGAASIAGERERGTFSVLLSAPVDRLAIGIGKSMVAVLYCMVLLTASLPVAAMSLLFGGPDIGALAGLYFSHAVLGTTMTLIGVAVSTLFRRTWTAAFVAIGTTAALTILTLALGALSLDSNSWDEKGVPFVLYFNPGFFLPLFFDGDGSWIRPGAWFLHYAAMGSMALASLVYALYRLSRTRD
jgi:ABC-2 type transport system permease protein